MDLIREQSEEFDTELEYKTNEYMKYLDNHINGVITAFKKYFVPLVAKGNLYKVANYSSDEFILAIKKTALRIDKHDLSKYNDLEFYPYRRYYYPTLKESNNTDEDQQTVEENFEKAFKHHYEHNSHHIEYWFDFANNIPKDMDLESIIEMICDWISMAYYFDSPIDSWWNDQKESEKERSMMTPNTIAAVNDIFAILTK